MRTPRTRLLHKTKRKRAGVRKTDMQKKDEDSRLLSILTSNLAAKEETNDGILDSSSFAGSTETVRQDIHTLTDNDRVVAPMKVTIAAVFGRIAYPMWDTRKHQVGIGGLKSLRSLDHTFVANNLHRLGLYRTATEGSLTRTFERKHAYTMDYPGEITPVKSRLAFLRLVNRVNEDSSPEVPITVLRYFLHRLQASKETVDALVSKGVSVKTSVSLEKIHTILDEMFDIGSGMSATPAIVVHTLFSVVQPHLWKDVILAPLKRHTASDSTSQAIGDVEAYKGTTPFLSVEIKHKLDIDNSMIRIFTQKTSGTFLRFMLTTKNIHTKYTEDNILIGNVTNIVLQYLHMTGIRDNTLFVTQLRDALLGSPDVSATNKTKISELFTKHLDAPSLE